MIRRKPEKLRSQRGQVIIEAVLLLTLGLFLWHGFSKYVSNSGWFSKMINGPWEQMAGMIEFGVWETPRKAKAMHPNRFDRVVSLKE